MGLVAVATARVGIEVTRNDSLWIPYSHRLFYCRTQDRGDAKRLSIRDWVASELECIGGALIPGSRKIPLGGSRRYWALVEVFAYRDYWGEYDGEVKVVKCSPAGPLVSLDL